MEQYKRKDFAHYFNTTPSDTNETYVLEGIGVEALSFSYNAQVSQFKTILDDVADSTFENYQIQSSVSNKRIYKGDAIYEFLNEARRNSTAIETQVIEVDMKSKSTTGSYDGLKYNILIVLDEFLGENAVIGYNLYVKGSPTKGTITIADKVPTFTPSAD